MFNDISARVYDFSVSFGFLKCLIWVLKSWSCLFKAFNLRPNNFCLFPHAWVGWTCGRGGLGRRRTGLGGLLSHSSPSLSSACPPLSSAVVVGKSEREDRSLFTECSSWGHGPCLEELYVLFQLISLDSGFVSGGSKMPPWQGTRPGWFCSVCMIPCEICSHCSDVCAFSFSSWRQSLVRRLQEFSSVLCGWVWSLPVSILHASLGLRTWRGDPEILKRKHKCLSCRSLLASCPALLQSHTLGSDEKRGGVGISCPLKH